MGNDAMLDSCFTRFKLDLAGTTSLAIRDVPVGGHRWRIHCYPRGCNVEDDGEYVSLSLELTAGDSKGGGVEVIFEAFVTKRDGAPSSSHAHRIPHVYSSPSQRQIRQFVKREDLESSPLYLSNGLVTITCGVIVAVRDDDDDPLDAPPPDIGTHLGLLLDSGDGSDVSFAVDGERFPAHRAVLAARSPVFKAQLLGLAAKQARATSSVFTVPDMAPATFRAMLRFVYTDALPADAELGDSPSEAYPRLLAAADRYGLDRLKLVCAGKLWGDVSAGTVAATLACAEACGCPELKTKCVGFLVDEKNFRDAVLTDGFVQLVHKFPSIIAELKEAGK